MVKIEIVNADAAEAARPVELLFTDPPYEMGGQSLARILARFDAPHLVMITTMRQLLEFTRHTDYEIAFDFVLDAVVPKKSMSAHQPNYVHQTGVYMKRPGVASAFDRKRHQRSDTFDGKGYWPTILRAPRGRMHEHGMAKNEQAMADLLGAFTCEDIADPFAGTGTTGMAAFEIGKDHCTLIERDEALCRDMYGAFRFLGSATTTRGFTP